jgi:hypothetical protein
MDNEELEKLMLEGEREKLELALTDTDDGKVEFYLSKEIYRRMLQTPFDHKIVGSTPPPWNFLNRRGHNARDYHTPIPILEGRFSIDQCQRMRKKIGFRVQSAPPWMNLNYKDIAISFEDLDPVTGVEVRDPRILGLYDKETNQITEIKGRDLTKDYYMGLVDPESNPSGPLPTIEKLLIDPTMIK